MIAFHNGRAEMIVEMIRLFISRLKFDQKLL